MMPLLLLVSLLQIPAEFVVAGTIVHGISGRPLNKARVFLASTENRAVARIVVTGADGKFRFTGVKSGKYNLAVERLGFVRQSYKERSLSQTYSSAIVTGEQEDTENIVFRLIPGATFTGKITGLFDQPAAGIAVQALRLAGAGEQRHLRGMMQASTNDRGEYRLPFLAAGTYILFVSGRPVPNQMIDLPTTEPSVYSPMFYPHATNPESASPVQIAAGQEIRADMVLQAVPAVNLEGQVAGTIDPKLAYTVSLRLTGTYGEALNLGSPVPVRMNAFTFERIPLGSYVVSLWADGRLAARATATVTPAGSKITIGDIPLAKVSVKTELRGEFRGPAAPTIVQIRLANGTPGESRAVEADGSSVFPAVPPGKYTVALVHGRPLALLSVKAKGASVSSDLVDVPETGDVELEIVADANGAEIPGKVFRENVPQVGVLALLLPTERSENISAYRFDQTDSDGSFSWKNVARGEYLMFTFEDGESADYADPAVIRKLLPKGKPLTVGETNQAVRLELPPKQ